MGAQLNICLGYKLRQQIAKALHARSSAVRSAVKRYNDVAANLTPPRPPLDLQTVLGYVYLAEFDILRDSRYDIQSKPWARAAERETSAAFFKLERAKEELVRLKVEVHRLATYMETEERCIRAGLQVLSSTRPYLAHQLGKVWRSMSAQFVTHRRRFATIERLDGFEGSTQIGTPLRQSSMHPDMTSTSERDLEAAGGRLEGANMEDGDDIESRSRILAQALAEDDVEVGDVDDEERQTLEDIEKAFEVVSLVD